MIRKNSAARTFLCLLLAFVFAASCLPQTIFATTDKKTVTTWPEGPENNSGAVCLLDADTGAVLYDKNMDEQRYPASITKILTALLIIENKQMTDTVTFGEHAVSESIPGNARINVQLGETITVEDALHAILLASANEVCTQLAIDIAGSEEGFAAMMNERAAALGCTNTHFVNANPWEQHRAILSMQTVCQIRTTTPVHTIWHSLCRSASKTRPSAASSPI